MRYTVLNTFKNHVVMDRILLRSTPLDMTVKCVWGFLNSVRHT
jgi:hypothetical protein